MALKDIQTNKNDLQEYLLLIAKVPEKVNKIDIDIKRELIIDIDIRISLLAKEISEIIHNNPNYPYPENYLPDKLFDYWAVRISQLFNVNELKSLKSWIEKSIYIENSTKETKEVVLLSNPYPLIFINENVFECFKNYQKHIIDFYIDYSYLKKRMLKQNFIHGITDIKFMNFLLNDLKIVKENENDLFIKNDSKFRALSKCYSESRENNFNIVFKSCL